MFVGHEFLAFALAGWAALGLGCDDPLHAGAVAGVAALLPDLDVVYAVATYAVAVAGGAPLGWEPFWGVANATHRVVTHTLPTGVVATMTFGGAVAVARRRMAPDRSVLRPDGVATVVLVSTALAGAAVLCAGFWIVGSLPAAVVAAGFLVCVAATGWWLAARAALSTVGLVAAAGVGFLSHPFGDVFLAVPPPLFSPFGPPLDAGRVSLAADSTLDLLGVLFVELAAVWAGLVVFSRVADGRLVSTSRLRDVVDARAVAGVAYAPAVVGLPRPTIADAHVLGATILPFAAIIGAWAGYASVHRGRAGGDGGAGIDRTTAVYAGVVTGSTALTLAAVAYTVVYTII